LPAEIGRTAKIKGYAGAPLGFIAPTGTHMQTEIKLNLEIVRILEVPEMKRRLTQDGADMVASTAQEFGACLASETKRWVQVIRQAGIRAD
jgi:tripartite-type tricarboxylate transporter receptor subunit TctC